MSETSSQELRWQLAESGGGSPEEDRNWSCPDIADTDEADPDEKQNGPQENDIPDHQSAVNRTS